MSELLSSLLLPMILLSSLLTGIVIFLLDPARQWLRNSMLLAGALLKLLLVAVLMWGVFHEYQFEVAWSLAPGLQLMLHGDALSVFFVTLSALLWLLTTLYAIGYLQADQHTPRFFGFFSLCVTATVGLALAGNLFTFVLFYELLTLATFPLVIHKGSAEAVQGARTYLSYTLLGGMVLLVSAVALQTMVGPLAFETGGISALQSYPHSTALVWVFIGLMLGLGVKCALFPLHGWLPKAMIAPAPVSALLHAVAVVKAGAFGIVRVVYDVYGIELAEQLGLLHGLAAVAGFTILYGSLRALRQSKLKVRLAWSTVSQVSYIVLGTAIYGATATVGGIVHLVHQGVMKITLFLAAGNYAEQQSVTDVKQMDGLGRVMPATSIAFTLGALGMIGVPPLAGFVTKWYLVDGALTAGMLWVPLLLVVSSLLNAAYFMPLLYRIWFKPAIPRQGRAYSRCLTWPPVVTAVLALSFGLFAAAPYSPLQWAELIAQREYP